MAFVNPATSSQFVCGSRPVRLAVCASRPSAVRMAADDAKKAEVKKSEPEAKAPEEKAPAAKAIETKAPAPAARAQGPVLAPRFNSSSFTNDNRSFRITYQARPSTRLYAVKELQQEIVRTKTVSFPRFYVEQVNIHRNGGKILNVERVSGVVVR